MKNIAQYLDATFLKTAHHGLNHEMIQKELDDLIRLASEYPVKILMVRNNHVAQLKKILQEQKSVTGVGTVIDFPMGNGGIETKIAEAQSAIANGADELDFVINYQAFKTGQIDAVKNEVFECTQLALQNNKIVKWIIETAALTDDEIIKISVLIKNVVMSHFAESDYERVFIKTSTGFYTTPDGSPNGARPHVVKLILENGYPLPVKASGGVRNLSDALKMIELGVERIGTSSHWEILTNQNSETPTDY